MVGGLQNVLIIGPMRVIGVLSDQTRANAYFEVQVRLQLMLGFILSVVSIWFLSVFYPVGRWLALSYGLCLFFVQLNEVARNVNFTRLAPRSTVFLDLVTHSTRMGALFLLLLSRSLSLSRVFLSIALGASAACLLFFRKHASSQKDHVRVLSILRKNWLFGRWLFIETLTYTLSTQIYLYYVAAFLNTQSAAAFSGIQSLLNTMNVVFIGVMSYSIPLARKKLLTVGYSAWKNYLFRVGAFSGVAAFLIISTLSFYAKPLLGRLYSPFYVQYAPLVSLFGVAYVFASFNTIFSAAFQTAGLPMVGSVAKSVSAVLTLGIGFLLVKHWGLPGAVTGMVLTQVVWTTVFSISLRMLNPTRLEDAKKSFGIDSQEEEGTIYGGIEGSQS